MIILLTNSVERISEVEISVIERIDTLIKPNSHLADHTTFICCQRCRTTDTNQNEADTCNRNRLDDLVKMLDLYRKAYVKEVNEIRSRYGSIFSNLLSEIADLQNK